MKVLLEFVTYNDTAENALLVAEKAHDGAGGDGDKPVSSTDRRRVERVAMAGFVISLVFGVEIFDRAIGYEGSLRQELVID